MKVPLTEPVKGIPATEVLLLCRETTTNTIVPTDEYLAAMEGMTRKNRRKTALRLQYHRQRMALMGLPRGERA